MDVKIKTSLTGDHHVLSLPRYAVGLDVKIVIADRLGINTTVQTLLLEDGRVLGDEDHLLSGEVEVGSYPTLQLIIAPEFYIYVLGGLGAQNKVLRVVERFHVLENSWDELTPMPMTCRNFAAVAFSGRIFVMGGREEDARRIGNSWCLHLDTGTWEEYPHMPTPRDGLSVSSDGYTMFAIGGWIYEGQTVAVVERFDLRCHSWDTLAPMPTSRAGLASVFADGSLYALGGSPQTAAVERFDLASGKWSTLTPLSVARVYLGAAYCLGYIYAIGGFDGSCLKTVERLDTSTGNWEVLQAEAFTSRAFHGVVAINDELYVFGGQNAAKEDLSDCLRFDMDLCKCIELSQMPTRRRLVAAVAV